MTSGALFFFAQMSSNVRVRSLPTRDISYFSNLADISRKNNQFADSRVALFRSRGDKKCQIEFICRPILGRNAFILNQPTEISTVSLVSFVSG